MNIKQVRDLALLLLMTAGCTFSTHDSGARVVANQNYDVIIIRLTVDGKPNLDLMVGKDGSIHRLGDGTLDSKDMDLYIGVIQDNLFDKIIAHWPENMGDKSGQYSAKEKKGRQCELEIMVANQAQNKGEHFLFSYGSESTGVPPEFAMYVSEAVYLTDPWYEKMQKMGKKEPNK